MMGDPNSYTTDFHQALRESLLAQPPSDAPNLHEPSTAAAAEATTTKKKGKKRPASASSTGTADDSESGHQAMVFPVKLHRMLTIIDGKANSPKDGTGTAAATSAANGDGTGEEDSTIVSWQPHGRCFLVHDKEAFVQRFLPR